MRDTNLEYLSELMQVDRKYNASYYNTSGIDDDALDSFFEACSTLTLTMSRCVGG